MLAVRTLGERSRASRNACTYASLLSPLALLLLQNSFPIIRTAPRTILTCSDLPTALRTCEPTPNTVCPGSSNVERIRDGKITRLCAPNNGHGGIFRGEIVRSERAKLRKTTAAGRLFRVAEKCVLREGRGRGGERRRGQDARVDQFLPSGGKCCAREREKPKLNFNARLIIWNARHYFELSTVLPERENYFEWQKAQFNGVTSPRGQRAARSPRAPFKIVAPSSTRYFERTRRLAHRKLDSARSRTRVLIIEVSPGTLKLALRFAQTHPSRYYVPATPATARTLRLSSPQSVVIALCIVFTACRGSRD